jgi:hypothetical protein
MFARGRSPRAYRVYAEDDFLEVDDPDVETDTGGDSTVDGVRPYSTASRGLPGALGGRVGLVLVVLVAVAVSALVAHALRAGIGGGGEATRASSVPPAARLAAVPPRGSPLAARTPRTPRASRRSGDVSFALRSTPRDGGARASHVAPERTSGSRPPVSDWPGSRASAMAANEGATDASSEGSAAAVPEFGFER